MISKRGWGRIGRGKRVRVPRTERGSDVERKGGLLTGRSMQPRTSRRRPAVELDLRARDRGREKGRHEPDGR